MAEFLDLTQDGEGCCAFYWLWRNKLFFPLSGSSLVSVHIHELLDRRFIGAVGSHRTTRPELWTDCAIVGLHGTTVEIDLPTGD